MSDATSTTTTWTRWARGLVVACAAAASVATSAPGPRTEHPRNFPRWQITVTPMRAYECATLRAWIPKSGKDGFGLSIEITSSADCTIEITRANLALTSRRGARRELDVQALPPAIELPGQSRLYTYVPFAFDNNDAWNDGLRDGTITLEMRMNGETVPAWTMSALHRLDGYHVATEPTKALAGPDSQ